MVNITSLTGQVMYQGDLEIGDNAIDANNWTNGMYIYTVLFNDTPIKSGKINIVK